MEKTTKEIVEAYALLREAKVTRMDDADKFKVIKALRPMRKVSEEFDDFRSDALEKLKGERHDEMAERARKWQQDGDKTTLTEAERAEVNAYFTEYNDKVTKCLKDEMGKTHDLGDTGLTDDALGKLVASNDWTLGQIETVAEVLQ